ncbi:MAG TPA: condensation domain-containing protein, partial [Candidatus Binatia bacterium]|nr:condensation domain-containing protein [Candidatus Binatia bacterium]
MDRLRALDVRLVADGERLRVNAPKGRLSAELRGQIAKKKSAILTLLNGGDPGPHSSAPSIPRLGDDEPAPLSFAQERLWFLEQLLPGSAVFHLCRATRILGPLDLAALQSSVNDLVRRHDALRTGFLAIDGRPFQSLRPFKKLSLEPVNLQPLAKTAQEREA